MKYMHSEWKMRLAHWIETLKRDFYHPLGVMETSAFMTMDSLTPDEAMRQTFSSMLPGTPWGHTWEYCWLKSRIVLPEQAKGKRIVMDLQTGGESTVYVNGRAFGTYRAGWVEVPHHYIVDNQLTRCGEPGQTYDVLVEAYAGHYYPESNVGNCATGPVLPGSYTDPKEGKLRTALGEMTYGIWNEEAYQLYMDLETLRQLCDQLDPDSLRADHVADALERSTLLIDFEQPIDGRIASYQLAREALRPVLSAVNGSTMPQFWAIGNAHLDLSWLWPMEETRRKTLRTFAAQLRLMEEYPEYRYLQSQPAAYVMCREQAPELYERIKQAVKAGQWIPEGAMWVEPDTNMPSGEALIRQVLHGKRFFREEFGVNSVILWLPDTFGYSAALPQILNGCGVRYLVTQKIFWSYNEVDQFPYQYFTWQGMDGSKVISFLPTSYTYRTDPKELCETWKKRVQKRGLDAFLLPFGYGDGGGGPARDHIEYLRREQNLEGLPRVKAASPVQFFEEMDAMGGPRNTYAGELYFSAHRGVYTVQAAIKKGNRLAEVALREAEVWGSLAMLKGKAYPARRMDAAWKMLLLNQFHDILPGSSIARVYEKARADHRWILSEANAVRDEALSSVVSGDGITVFNSLSFERTGLVPLSADFAKGAETLDGVPVPVQTKEGRTVGLVTVPACGAVSLRAASGDKTVSVSAEKIGDRFVLQNEWIRAEIDDRGEVVSFVNRESGREIAAGPMNHLLLYKDVPRTFDAWDIDSNYILQPVEIREPASVAVTEAEGLRAVIHVSRKLSNSEFDQDIVLTAGSRRIEFVTHVDWRELHRLLKVDFPVDVQAEEGINEIQFGYVTRPNHRSRQYDKERYEVCNHRYSALCDQSHGAAVLNNCKYGISMNDNALRLTLLRAAASPEMRTDNGEHEFTYAFTAWEGSFLDSPVVIEAYDLNTPLQVVHGACETFSAFNTDSENVLIDTVKPAEDGGGDIILRLYEAKKADTVCRLNVNVPVDAAWLCDMLENNQESLETNGGQFRLHFRPFEVKTLRIRAK